MVAPVTLGMFQLNRVIPTEQKASAILGLAEHGEAFFHFCAVRSMARSPFKRPQLVFLASDGVLHLFVFFPCAGVEPGAIKSAFWSNAQVPEFASRRGLENRGNGR